MKKNIIILLLLSFILPGIGAQEKLEINYESIKKAVTSENTYKELLKRYEANDTTLKKNDYSILYYGQLYQKSYNPYNVEGLDEANKLMKAKEYNKAYEQCLKILQKNPVSLNTLENLYYAGKAMGKPQEELENYIMKFWKLMNMIVSTGDGQSEKTAFHVICVNDEYQLLRNYFEIEGFKQQSLVNSGENSYDLMEFTSSKYYEGTKIYFDITKVFDFLNNAFK